MTTHCFRPFVAIGFVLAIVSAAHAQTTSDDAVAGFSAEVRELIEIGDAALLRSLESRELSSSIQTKLKDLERDSGKGSRKSQTRALTTDEVSSGIPLSSVLKDDSVTQQTLEALRIEADETAKKSEEEAIKAWKRAMAIDPNAQETILRRLLGTRPRS